MASYLDANGLQYLIKKSRDTYFPIGSIFATTSTANPAQTIGGTWERYAPGRVLVSADPNDGDFALGRYGGEKAHVLGVPEMPGHRHEFAVHKPSYHTDFRDMKAANSNTYDLQMGTQWTSAAGNDQPHNNLQPYVSVNIWRRVG